MQRGFTLIIILVGIVVLVGLVGGGYYYFQKQQAIKNINTQPISEEEKKKLQPPNDGQVCIQVITPAKNLKTGECKDFPNPCDVPLGWEKVDKCSASSVDTTNWKTYVNKEQGYSIKYPQKWFILKDSLFDGNIIGSISTASVEDSSTSVLRIEIHTGNLSYERYAYFYHLYPKALSIDLGKVNINGSVWEKLSNSNDLSSNNSLYVLGTTNNNKKYF